MVFRLWALAVGQTDGAGKRSRDAKAVGGTQGHFPSPFAERKKIDFPVNWGEGIQPLKTPLNTPCCGGVRAPLSMYVLIL